MSRKPVAAVVAETPPPGGAGRRARAHPSPHPSPLLRHALEALQPTRAELAAALGVSGAALHSYHAGTRRASRPTHRLVAAYLRAHAAALVGLAAALEAELAHERPGDAREPGEAPGE